jgi:hypothetical protein
MLMRIIHRMIDLLVSKSIREAENTAIGNYR